MDQIARGKLNEILRELNSITRELESTAMELSSFKGIGAEKCAAKLHRISAKYRTAKYYLSQMR